MVSCLKGGCTTKYLMQSEKEFFSLDLLGKANIFFAAIHIDWYRPGFNYVKTVLCYIAVKELYHEHQRYRSRHRF